MSGEPRGLRHYLEQKRGSMLAAAERKPKGAEWRETVSAVCRADDATGVRKLSLGKWEITGDSGPDFGGWGLGPSSPQLLCGVIGTCLTHTYLIGAAMMGIPLDAVEVEVASENNDAWLLGVDSDDPPLPYNMRATVHVVAPDAEPGELAELHRYVEATCPLTAFVRQSNEFTITVE